MAQHVTGIISVSITCGHCHSTHDSVAAVRTCSLAGQQVPGLPGITYGQVAATTTDTTGTTAYGRIKGLRRYLAAELAQLVPTHDKFRVALVMPGEDKVRFFVIDTPLRGKWAGYVFVKEQAGDDLHPVKPVAREEKIVQALLGNAKVAMEQYAAELGSCGICGRTLTDEESRARGIGPVCAAKATGW